MWTLLSKNVFKKIGCTWMQATAKITNIILCQTPALKL